MWSAFPREVVGVTTWGIVGLAVVLAYVAVCFGRIAGKHGRNPILYGILSIISPVNLVLLGIWAFSRVESTKRD
jgi:hypothetical protein